MSSPPFCTKEIIYQFHVSVEGLKNEVRRLAEGVAKLNEKLNCIHDGLKREFRKQQQRMGGTLLKTYIFYK
jgi:archaellum component FlaC